MAIESFVVAEEEIGIHHLTSHETKHPVDERRNLKEEPSIRAEIESEGAFVLVLSLPIMGFPVRFTFKLLPVAREQFDVLESALRDAQEEIERLKRENIALKARVFHPAVISLRSTSACTNGGVVTWNITERNTDSDLFLVQPTHQGVQITTAGLYQVSVRVTSTDGTGNRNVQLRVNGAVVAQAWNGFNTGYNGSIQIGEMIVVKENAVISVNFNFGNAFNTTQYTNHLWIMRID